MPELPEVETVRRDLSRLIVGKKIIDIVASTPKQVLPSLAVIRKAIVGAIIRRVDRRAKLLQIFLSGGKILVIHLKLTGQLIYRNGKEDKKSKKNGVIEEKNGPFAVAKLLGKHTRAVFDFAGGGRLYFNDLRKFGWIRLVTEKELETINRKLGVEPFDKKFGHQYLSAVFSKTTRPIKQVLIDQEKITGMGNIYANEALFLAGIKPTKPAKKLSKKEIIGLRKAIVRVLKEAILHKGTSDRDEAYRQANGRKGHHQDFLSVYRRSGEKCIRCDGTIERIKIGGRGTFFCPKCQR